jgi:TRAP-type C4-dicarboxylate transport system permease small subunit
MRPTDGTGAPPAPGGRGGAARGDAGPEAVREAFGPGPTGLLTLAPWLRALERALAVVPALILLAMMLLTFANVVLRYVFRTPVSGAFELMSYMMAVLVFLSLVLVTARTEHVRISVIDGFLPRRLRQVRAVLFNLAMAGLAAGLAWRFWLHAQRPRVKTEVTQMYHLPIGRLIEFMAVCTGLCALLFLAAAVAVALRRSFLSEVEP